MKLKELLPHRFLNEAKDLGDEVDFMFFYIEDIKDLDEITDVEDLLERDYLVVTLWTDQNCKKDKLTNSDACKIPTEDLHSYMATRIPDYELGDYLDFMGGFGIADLVANYLESAYPVKHYKDWDDFKNIMMIDSDDKLSGTDDESLEIQK